MATQSQINASLGLPPGINPDGSWNAQDYIARKVSGQPDTQAQVDAANAANPYSAQNMAKVDVTRQGQYVDDPITGETVALTSYSPGFDINNKTALTYIGEGLARGGQDSTSQQFLAIATPAQKAEADRLWSIEKARLEEIDRQNALKAQADQGANRGADAQASKAVANPAALPKGFLEGLTAIPNITDQQIVSAMKTAKVSPKNLADGLGISEGEVAARVAATIPNGESVTLGDTVIVPQYRVTGSGETQEVGALETFFTSKTNGDPNYKAPVGSEMKQFGADGVFQQTIKTKKELSFLGGIVDMLKDPVVLAAIGGAAAGGLLGTGGATLGGTTGLTLSELGGTAGAGLLSGGAGTVAGTVAGAATTLGGASTAGSLLGGSTLANSLLTSAGTGVVNKLLGGTSGSANISNLISGGLGTAGNLLQMQQSREAAQQAQARIDAETAAAKQSAAFRPVGMTTRFGTSQFQTDPVTGQLISAGYTASPGVLEAQNRLVALGNQGLAQAEGAQAQFAPLQTGAQSLFNLGNQYISQSPQDVAQNYLNQQMALLKPGRETELANLQNRLQQQGRGGLAVAQGGTLGDTTPELQALFNARAQQEAVLAANAQQAGQQQVLYGAGLLGQGSQAMGQYYGGQQAAYAPYTTALGQFQNLETLAQQPLTMGAALGQQAATAGANVGRLGLTGAQLSTNLATSADATRNLAAQGLIAAGNPNAQFGQAIGGLFGGGLQSAFSGTGLGSSGFGTGLAYGNQDLGLFL
jgi:hypothetical protein